MPKLTKTEQLQSKIRKIWPDEVVHVEFQFNCKNHFGWYLSKKTPTATYGVVIGASFDEASEWLEDFVHLHKHPLSWKKDCRHWDEISCEYRHLNKAVNNTLKEVINTTTHINITGMTESTFLIHYKVALFDEYPLFAFTIDDCLSIGRIRMADGIARREMKSLLTESANIRKELARKEAGNKDYMIGSLSMELAMERRKTSYCKITHPPNDLAYDPEYYEKAISLLTEYGIGMEAFSRAYRFVEKSALKCYQDRTQIVSQSKTDSNSAAVAYEKIFKKKLELDSLITNSSEFLGAHLRSVFGGNIKTLEQLSPESYGEADQILAALIRSVKRESKHQPDDPPQSMEVGPELHKAC